MQNLYDRVNIRYLQEFTALGTAGGMYHFRDQISAGNPAAFFVLNGDVCADFPLAELLDFHSSKGGIVTIMGTESERLQSLNYGCLVTEKHTPGKVTHYVEKPETFVSTLINCGVYVFSTEVFAEMAAVYKLRQLNYPNYLNNGNGSECIQLETDILTPLAGTGKLYALPVQNWWSQVKTAGSAIYANRHYLQLYRTAHPERLANAGTKQAKNGDDGHLPCTIYPDVFIHPTAQVDASATLGPNVSVSAGVVIGPGVRVRESILLENSTIKDHSLVLYSIVGKNSSIGMWSRVEGTPSDPDPNKPFAKMENTPLFNKEGKLNPSISILGSSVAVPSEMVLLNSIVLPHKELSRSYKNEIIL